MKVTTENILHAVRSADLVHEVMKKFEGQDYLVALNAIEQCRNYLQWAHNESEKHGYSNELEKQAKYLVGQPKY